MVVLVSAGAPVLYLGARFLHKLFFTKRYSAKVLADPAMNSVAVAVHTGTVSPLTQSATSNWQLQTARLSTVHAHTPAGAPCMARSARIR